MKRSTPDWDETVRLAPNQPVPRRSRSLGLKLSLGAAIGLTIVAMAAAGWVVALKREPLLSSASRSMSLPVTVRELPIDVAAVEQIRQNEPTDLSVIRLVENPQILVLDFASLARQGHMLDRMAALIEKTNLPKDRLLSPQELDVAVKAGGDMQVGFYYGHDYSAASFQRFFAIADRDKVQLTAEEVTLRRLLDRLGWLKPGVVAGLISVPRVAADDNVTPAARNAILTHELSHGEYFSNPAYAAYVHRFFMDVMTPSEREAFRDFLAHDGYDIGNAELVENETQAYLLFTVDVRFFSPEQVKMTASRRRELRTLFLRDMGDGWLKTLLVGLA